MAFWAVCKIGAIFCAILVSPQKAIVGINYFAYSCNYLCRDEKYCQILKITFVVIHNNRNIPWNLYSEPSVKAGGHPGTPGSTGPAVLRELYSVSRWLSCDIEVRATALFFANRFMKIWNLPRDIRYIIDKRRKKENELFLHQPALLGCLREL